MPAPVFTSNLGFANPYGSTSSKVNQLFKSKNQRKATNGMLIQRVPPESPLFVETVQVLGKGECGSEKTAPDPLLDWVFAGTEKQAGCKPLGSKPSEYRREWFKWMASYCAWFSVARGGLYALVDQRSGKVMAAASTGPPNTAYKKDSGPSYFYVVMFATLPEAQGRGCGKALLNFLGEVADADGVVAFLETAGVRNVGFYNTGGYEEVVRSPVAGFKGDGIGMIRRKRSAMAVTQQEKEEEEVDCPFIAKRPSGPLSNYCRTCGAHKSGHD
ncbi:hypothetical protein TL16_g09979 [Triparma laevis f. inornata]|uniref:N-acetyltransferase domain-containing protein n=1 Tax=Triparma laevis f. inornata TaxID=1714386 RepID=A0A9W7BDG8_9STRA|nr:hypothetical protein TL16_g09979 [Triparma laevis f. inornata]